MKRNVEKYAEASGTKSDIVTQFDSLNSSLPKLSKGLSEAAVQIRDHLYENGFSYVPNTFTLQEVLRAKGGNCLGLPLLVGAILSERGFNPTYQLVTNPKDTTFRLESLFFNRISDQVRSGIISSTESREESPMYRFIPLEHLVLNDDENLIELTSSESEHYDSESSHQVSFDEALSCVYKDRAARFIEANNAQKAKELLKKGLSQWKDNRNIHSQLATLAIHAEDESSFSKHLAKFRSLPYDDSLHNYNLYLLTNEESYLDRALKRYPAYAQALVEKASILGKSNPKEARTLLAIASHCFANSGVLDFDRFLMDNSANITEPSQEQNA